MGAHWRSYGLGLRCLSRLEELGLLSGLLLVAIELGGVVSWLYIYV
jgi:hypothetical protein